MTIIVPKKTKSSFNFIIIVLILLSLTTAYLNVFIYNRTVSLSRALDVVNGKLSELKTTDADLRNQLYQLTSANYLIQFAEKRGFTKVRAPQYLELEGTWSTASASQL